MTVDLERLKGLLEHVSMPLEISKYTNYEGYSIFAPNVGCVAERWPAAEGNSMRPYGELIVEAVNALPALLREREELLALVERWRKGSARSRATWLKTSEDDEAWHTQLETNMNDLTLCADELESVLSAAVRT